MSLDPLKDKSLNENSMDPRNATQEDTFMDKHGGKVGPAAQGVGLAFDIVSQLKQNSAQRDMVRSEAQKEQGALRRQHRADFGSMLAQGGASGISGSSFQDLFNNQTIEDARQMASLKQDEQNKIAKLKNQKRAGITKSVMNTAKNVALGGAG